MAAEAGAHEGDTRIEVAFGSKPEGRSSLLLSRLTRCRNTPGQTADDAVLTLKILITYYKFFAGGAPKKQRSHATGGGQFTKRRSRTFMTRPIARNTRAMWSMVLLSARVFGETRAVDRNR